MDYLSALPIAWQIGIVAVAAVTALYVLWQAKRAVMTLARRPVEDLLTIVAASIATGVSAQGMWRFSGDVLGLDGPLRILLFAFIEVAVVTSAVRARRNIGADRPAGVDGMAVWVFTGLTAVLSALDARSLAEAIFRLAAPLVAAWLWERGMTAERQRLTGLTGIHWRITPQRVLVRLGLAEAKDRTVTEVDVHRRLTRLALAAKLVHQLRTAGAKPRKVAAATARRDRALDQAVEHTDLATNPTTRARLLDITITLGGAEDLTTLLATAPAPWADDDHPAVNGRVRHSEAVMLAAALNLNTAARLGPVATAPATGRGSDGERAADGAELPPPSAEGRSWLASLTPWWRPQPRPVAALVDDRQPVADLVAEEPPAEEAVATESRPVADRPKPTDQDRKRAIRFYIQQTKKLNPPSKRTLADWTGFGETWALGCIQEGRQSMIDEGWTFDEKGGPIPPRPVAGPVATTAAPATGTASVNGSAPTAGGGG
ncbi:hypothetical protein [Sphaerisporangium sp. TRM90804]|uniref:hypothetical protein n=1 Tax=Sphaerisporangium sp. TRM90804 TaxID=3031113 RepID=UPI00244D3303|nr:hypothetical protein [Sphaerisporangium sp. TRM90804]MDH2425811.1 hypothetical protein [Sphaerisporangium sp. TRM90804]